MKMMGNELQYITLDGTLVDTLLREGRRLRVTFITTMVYLQSHNGFKHRSIVVYLQESCCQVFQNKI